MVLGGVLNKSGLSSKRRVVNTVFPQPEGPAIIKLVGVLNVNASLLSTTQALDSKKKLFQLHSYNNYLRRPHLVVV